MSKTACCCGVACNFFDFIVVLEGLPAQALEGCFLLGGLSLLIICASYTTYHFMVHCFDVIIEQLFFANVKN
jgi:hypothetical protein